MTVRRILISVVLCFGLSQAGLAQVGVERAPVIEEFSRVSGQVSRVTTELIEVMNDATAKDGYRYRAIEALGHLKQDDAILPLFAQLLFKSDLVLEPGPLTCFPVARALSQYGSNVYSTLPAVCLEERSPEYVYVLACLLHTIDGKRIAILRVEKLQADKPLSATQRQNYTRLLNRLKTTDFDDPLKWPRLNLKQQVKVDVRAEAAH